MKKIENIDNYLINGDVIIREEINVGNIGMAKARKDTQNSSGADWWDPTTRDGHTIYFHGVGWPCDYGKKN